MSAAASARATAVRLRNAAAVMPVAILPERYFGTTSFGLRKTGPFRAAFLLESLEELGGELARLGAPMLVACGDPAPILTWLCQRHAVTDLWYQDEPGTEEADEVRHMEAAIPDGVARHPHRQVSLRRFAGLKVPPVDHALQVECGKQKRECWTTKGNAMNCECAK